MRLCARLLVVLAVVLSLAPDLEAVVQPRSSAAEKVYRHPGLYIAPAFAPVSALTPDAAHGAEGDLAALGWGADSALYDRRAGRLASFTLALPLIPGTGVGNDLRWPDAAAPSPAEIGDAAWTALLDLLGRNQAALRIDAAEFGTPRIVVHGDGALVQIWAPRLIQDVPVRDASLAAVINHGNLVLLGVDNWGDVSPATPLLDPEQARAAIVQHVQPLAIADARAREASLEYLPLAKGEGYDFRLVWVVPTTLFGDGGTWEGLVDAATGELLAFQDRNLYVARKVVGGVFPVSNDGVAPDGIEQAGWPMPFTDVTTPGGPLTTNSAGVLGCTTGTVTTALQGRYTRISDACGAVNESSAAGDLNLGNGAGTNCTVPAGHSAGDTHAARTGMYELTRLNEHARSYLPANTWLQSQLTANMNINLTCNAFWNGSSVNFYRMGGGCGNTGEIAAIFDHEWGHGMDNNGVNPTVSSPGEAIADIHALLRLDTSCIGRGFLIGANCGGYGDACTACSGVREVDFARHVSGTPHTLAFAQACPNSGSRGPCNRETHCEGVIVAEAGWDLVNRDLPALGLDHNTSLEIGARLFFVGSGPVTNWYQCVAGTAGCPATAGYPNLLAADDDNGTLADGTPHMTAIFAAFNRHGIACATPAVVNSGCAGGPTTAPTLSATAQDQTVSLSWTAVPNAARYDVFQTEGVNGANFGKVKIGQVTGTTFQAENLMNGRTYHFNVLPVGATAACLGRMSNTITTAPVAGPNLGVLPNVTVTVNGGDNDGILDNCETATFGVTVSNTGTGALTNARIVAVVPLTHPASVVVTPLPATIAASLAECVNATGTVTVRPVGLAFNQTTQFRIDVTADELAGQVRSVIATVSGVESDWQATASRTFSFETNGNLEGWQVAQGTWTQDTLNGGANGTTRYVRSSNAVNGVCDTIRSPRVRLTATSTLSLSSFFTIENITGGLWYDRANVGLVDAATGARNLVTPSSGRLYNASGNAAAGLCVGAEAGWAGTNASWAASNWSAAALNAAGRIVHLDVRYATDGSVALNGFRYDEVTLANFDQQVADVQSDLCCAAITVNPATIPSGTAGTAYSQTFTQTGGTAPITWSVSGTLPTGITLNTTTGVLSGTPTQGGSFPITITATATGGCTGSRAYTLVINCQTITVNPATIPSGTAGTAYSQTFTQTSGIGTITWSVSGTLPTGVTLNTTTGVLSGTPTQTGSFPITVTATDANGCTGSRAVTLVINCQTLTVNPATIPSGTAGTAYSQTFTQTSGIGTITWSVSGTLPTGVTLNTSTGVLSGTPTQTGSFPITVTATDANGCTGSRAVTLVINCQTLTVNPATIASGTVGTAYSQTFTQTSGIGTITWSVSGTLPTGVTLNTTTGVLSGTPTQTGSFPITVTATDANGCTGSRAYTLVINCQTITVNPATIAAGTVGTAYSQTFTQTSGIGTIAWSVSGTLPTGVTLNTSTGVLSGTPTQTGSFPITVSATDANGCIGSRAYTLVINCQTITVNPTTIASGTVGTAYSQTFTQTSGIGTIAWSVSGTLPTGVTLNTSTGVLSGTPTQTGSFPITVSATDANGCIGSRAYTLVINCQTITVNPTTIASGTAGTAYSQTFTQTSGIGTITWSVSGTLPTGVTLNTSTGVLSGTPTQTGSFPITVSATDANGCTGSRAYTLVINCQTITVNPTTIAGGTAGTAYSQTFTQTSGIGTITWSVSGTLPTGVTLNASTGVLSGTPTQTGSFPITVTATDANGCTGSRAYTLVIGCQTITVNPATIPNAVAGTAYSQTFTQTSGIGTVTWSLTGTLPAGLTLNATTGVLSGTPTQLGSFPITVTATDSNGCTGARGYTLVVDRAGPFVPTALDVDTAGNRVFEPGETVAVAPSWRNDTGAPLTVTGAATNFTGPAGGTYTIIDGVASYGAVAAGATATCTGSNDCYALTVAQPGARPVSHWDTTVLETLSATDTKTWTLHVGATFTDVAPASTFYRFVETIVHKNVTGGCGADTYCPANPTSREQMAVFVLVSREAPGYTPPACTTPMFSDVPAASPFCKWIEELARRGVVGGCEPGKYCPSSPATREQMAVFVLRTLDPALNPPACTTPMFGDVPAASPYCKWIEELVRRGVVTGCGGGSYCPTGNVTREQMSVFLAATFGLRLYGI